MQTAAVDINCDMGEGYGQWRLGDIDDADLMKLISSANIATGFHAGDPNLMDATVRLATQHGVGVGAHPGLVGAASTAPARNWSTTSSTKSGRCANLPAVTAPPCSM